MSGSVLSGTRTWRWLPRGDWYFGAETGQDRASRCAHQAGVYGQAAGNREAYVGGCINQ
ncbi:MAG: hypothetical protein WCG00_03860 [Hyphomicrobiales bacterium]